MANLFVSGFGELPHRWHLGAVDGPPELWPSGPIRGRFLLPAAPMAGHGRGHQRDAWSCSILATARIQFLRFGTIFRTPWLGKNVTLKC